MSRGALAIAMAILSGCMAEDRYVVDGAMLDRIARPPAPELVNVGMRRVGDLVVQIACDEPLGTYSGTVAGSAGTWRFKEVTWPEEDPGPCNSREALDRMAAHVASLYVNQRGALAVRRSSDGAKVYVGLNAFDFSTLRTNGGSTTVIARGRSPLWWPPVGLVPSGAAALGGGLVLLTKGFETCNQHDFGELVGCQLGPGIAPIWGGVFTALGAIALATSIILTPLAAADHPQEVQAHSSRKIYFAPEPAPRPPPRDE